MRLKKIIITSVVFLLIVNLMIVVTDHSYLYKGIANTYLKGRKGPGIFDLKVFPSNKITAIKPVALPKKNSNYSLQSTHREALENLETNSFLVLKNDTIVYEEYWGTKAEMVTNSFSAAKSVIGILVGIALKEGFITDLSDPVAKYLPHFKSDSLSSITIYHLLSMSSGLYWIESGANPFSHNAKAYYGKNLEEMMNELEYEKTPGVTFEYKSGNSQVLAMLLTKATGMSVSQFANDYLWNNIGASSDAFWSLDRKGGMEKAYCCLYATGQDFAKIGMLMEHYGYANGKQILDTEYVMASTMPTDLMKINGEPNSVYGLHWWILRNYNNMSGYYARGILGQYIIVIPNRKLIIVRTGQQRMGKSNGFHPDDLYLYLDIAHDILTNEERY